MAQQVIDVGASPNAAGADPLRVGGEKINANFVELYGRVDALEVDQPLQDSGILRANNEADRANLRLDTLQAADVELDTSGFNNNLGPGVDTVQKLADWVDNNAGSGSGSGSGSGTAAGVDTDFSSFNRVLTVGDTNVQSALDRLDNEVAREVDLAAEALARASADAALSLRIDALVVDPVTKAYVDTQDGLRLLKADVIDNLTTNVATKALSAKQDRKSVV
jgi:hypothetical protein